MTSKERVKAAFAHKEADKVPVDFCGMSCSNINAIVMRQLREYYGLPKIPVRIKDMSTMVGVMERDLMDALGCVRDIAEWYTAPLLYPEYVHEVFDIENERAIESFKKYYDAFGNDIDVLFICGTDFGSQRGPLMGVDTFRAIFMPHYKKVCDWVHSNTEWKILKHWRHLPLIALHD
ncbi:MAG: hypothetical protein LBT13_06485 [Treponema sp.]|jgi:hypothetical protein|nr:hypothetical protein [Treponema sp.]